MKLDMGSDVRHGSRHPNDRWGLGFSRVSIIANSYFRRSPMPYASTEALERALAAVNKARSQRRASRSLGRDQALQELVASMVAARTRCGMTQQEVAARMWTTKSAVSRLESGRCTRPTLNTIEKYALAVGARLEIRLRPGR
jgi:ribosome-binding protein aMBF1 (putative translation factor)